MTIVCAYRSADGEIWLGADTRVSSEGFIYPTRDVKWSRYGDWAWALSGASSVDMHLRHGAERLKGCENPWDLAWVIHELAKEGDFLRRDDESCKGEPPVYSWNMIAARAEGMWLLSGSGAVTVPNAPFLAVGSGCDFAYGAAHALLRAEYPGDVVVRHAIEAAIAFEAGCGGDIVVERF